MLRRLGRKGSLPVVGAAGAAAAAGALAAFVASGQRSLVAGADRGALNELARTSNVMGLGILQKLLRDQRIIQRPMRDGSIRWEPAALNNGGLANPNANIAWLFSAAAGPSIQAIACNPRGLTGDELKRFLDGTFFPSPAFCALDPVKSLRPAVNFTQVDNRFTPPYSFRLTVQAVTRLADNKGVQGAALTNAQFDLPIPQPYCELEVSPASIKEGERARFTLTTVLGVTSARWTFSGGPPPPGGSSPGNPVGETRTVHFPNPGTYTATVTVTGLPGAVPPTATCSRSITVTPKPCPFLTLGYQEPFSYPGPQAPLGVPSIFGRGINTMGDPRCSTWGHCSRRGIYSTDVPRVPGFGGVANWSWLPGACMSPQHQCVTIHLGCNCNTPIASVIIQNINRSNCRPRFLMWRPPGGCFTPGTRLLAADGGWIRADHVRPGQWLWNPVRRQPTVVARVYRGPERAPLYEVVAGSTAVTVTELHVFPTDGGPRQARELRVGDRLLAADGRYVPLDSVRRVPPAADQWVWNFDLEGTGGSEEDHLVVAEGLVTGDMVLQNRRQEALP